MTQYRKKPIAIEAVQFNGLNPTEIKEFVGENCEVEIYDNKVTPPVASIIIHTLEGDMEVSNGDYVIKGVKGEFYPCKPDIFEQTYESVEIQQEQSAKQGYKDCNGCEYNQTLKDQIGWQFRGCFGGDYKGKPIAKIELCPLKVVQQKQPEVDLEKEIQECWQNWLSPSNQNSVDGVLPKEEFAFYAHHFYELGKNSK